MWRNSLIPMQTCTHPTSPTDHIYIICFPQKKRNWLNLNSIYQTNLKCLMIFPSKETSSMISMVVVVDQNYPAKELCICFTAYPTIFYLVVSSKSSQFRPRDPPSDTQSYRNFQKMAPNWPSLHSTSLAGQKPGQPSQTLGWCKLENSSQDGNRSVSTHSIMLFGTGNQVMPFSVRGNH